ncbi:hypothetical protein F7725_005313 [Dissostichus mawsoni]|uniref:Uncharacterized protein n=1 Tax=Dissostichus mawsoni TaxID=36200 RepID=A0A7J5YUY0_DISMA|nr:hypothetical protein F7725_005313 [Dissostichus mawsoni]
MDTILCKPVTMAAAPPVMALLPVVTVAWTTLALLAPRRMLGFLEDVSSEACSSMSEGGGTRSVHQVLGGRQVCLVVVDDHDVFGHVFELLGDGLGVHQFEDALLPLGPLDVAGAGVLVLEEVQQELPEGDHLLVFVLAALLRGYLHLCLCNHVWTHGSVKEVWHLVVVHQHLGGVALLLSHAGAGHLLHNDCWEVLSLLSVLHLFIGLLIFTLAFSLLPTPGPPPPLPPAGESCDILHHRPTIIDQHH